MPSVNLGASLWRLSGSVPCKSATLSTKALPDLCNFRFNSVFEEVKTEIMICFETSSKFYFVGLKAERYNGGGRILLDDNRGSGAIMLLPRRFHCAGIWIWTGLSYIGHTWPYAF